MKERVGLYLVFVVGGSCAALQVAHLAVLVSHNERPLKLHQQEASPHRSCRERGKGADVGSKDQSTHQL